MSDLDLVGLLGSVLPQGATPSADSSLITTGKVYKVDAVARTVQVEVRSVVLDLPAMPGRYVLSGLAYVLHDPAAGRPVLVLAPVAPAPPAVRATVSAVAGNVVTVSWSGVNTPLPAIPSTYTVGATAWVLVDDWGLPVMVQGPSALPPPEPDPDPGPPPSGGGTQRLTVTIGPQWSGTYRHIRGAWDRWNVNRYGGRSTLYQGNAFGSGPLSGLATYGGQVANLGAESIERIEVAIRNLGIPTSAGPAGVQSAVQGNPAPGGGPTGLGAVVGGENWVTLDPGTYEAWRTGGAQGVAIVGGSYCAFAGAGNGDGMTLRVTHTRRV